MSRKNDVWFCKIGYADRGKMIRNCDIPMREAIYQAFLELTGKPPLFIFSGWGQELTPEEKHIAEDGVIH